MSWRLLIGAVIWITVGTAQAQDWPMSRGTLQGTATVRLPGTITGKAQAWQFQAGSHVWGYQPGITVWSSAALGAVQGSPLVFVGSYDNNLYCLDAITGKRRWRFTTGGGVYSAPVFWRGRKKPMVFVTSSDRLVYALDADLGRRLWISSVEAWRPTMGGARLSSPCLGKIAQQDTLFFGHWVWDKSLSGHLQAGGVTALAALTGKKLWTTKLGDNQVSSPIFAVINDQPRVFIASESGNLFALDGASGEILWTHTDRHAIKASPVLFDSITGPRLIIGSKFGRVRCLDAASGKEIWRVKTGHWVDGSAAVATLFGEPVVFVGSYDNHLYALDGISGAVKWTYQTAAGIYSSPAVIQQGTRGERGKQGEQGEQGEQTKILFSAWDHHLHCLDGNGALLWSVYLGRPLWNSITLGDSIWSSPSIAIIDGQPVVYQGSYAGPFHAIPLAQAAEAALARPGSNIKFWLTLPLVMLIVTLVTLYLTRRYRRLSS